MTLIAKERGMPAETSVNGRFTDDKGKKKKKSGPKVFAVPRSLRFLWHVARCHMVFGCCKSSPAIVRDLKLVCVGIDGDGKTTVLKLLRGDDPLTVMSTNGFSKVSMAFSDTFDVIVYDLGGGPRIRDIWENYYAEVHGAIFVIDISGERINEAYDCLRSFVRHDDLFGKPILFVLNKVEAGKVDEIDFAEQADLHNICGERKQSSFVTHVNQLETKGAPKKSQKTVRERSEQEMTPLLLQFCNFVDKIIQDYVELQEGVLAAEEKLRKRQEEARKARKLRLMQMEHEQRINGDAANNNNNNDNGVCETAETEPSPSVPSVETATPLSDEVFQPDPAPVPKNKVVPINGTSLNKSSINLRDASMFNVPLPQNGLPDEGASSKTTVREKPRLQRIREELERRKQEAASSSNS